MVYFSFLKCSKTIRRRKSEAIIMIETAFYIAGLLLLIPIAMAILIALGTVGVLGSLGVGVGVISLLHRLKRNETFWKIFVIVSIILVCSMFANS